MDNSPAQGLGGKGAADRLRQAVTVDLARTLGHEQAAAVCEAIEHGDAIALATWHAAEARVRAGGAN